MKSTPATQRPERRTAANFRTTRWTEIREAPDNQAALAGLCGKYWYPLYAFLRRSGTGAHEAEDLTQGFFAHLLGKEGLRTVCQEHGKFRSFLIASLRHYVSDQRDRSMAAKRTPDRPLFEIDGQSAEDRYRLEPVDRMSPERIFERRWAATLLEEGLRSLEAEFIEGQKGELFQRLQPFLTGKPESGAYQSAAAGLGMSEGAVRVTIHRMRSRFRELVRKEISDTLDVGEDVEGELRYLFAVLRNE